MGMQTTTTQLVGISAVITTLSITHMWCTAQQITSRESTQAAALRAPCKVSSKAISSETVTNQCQTLTSPHAMWMVTLSKVCRRLFCHVHSGHAIFFSVSVFFIDP